MSEIQSLIVNKLENVESDLTEMKVTLAENTKDLKHHIKRTDDLQMIVTDVKKIVDPLYQDYISKKAVEDYKKKSRDDLVYKLRLPVLIVGALTAMGTILAYFIR